MADRSLRYWHRQAISAKIRAQLSTWATLCYSTIGCEVAWPNSEMVVGRSFRNANQGVTVIGTRIALLREHALVSAHGAEVRPGARGVA